MMKDADTPIAELFPMTLRRVFVDAVRDGAAFVEGARAHHLARAVRLKTGEAVEISIATKKGRKTYSVTYSPRAERFITKSPEKANVKDLETKGAVVVGDEKKKKRHNVMSK